MIARRLWIAGGAMALWALGALSALAQEGAAILSRRAQAYDLYTQAQMLMFDRKEELALTLLEKAIRLDPDPALLLETARVHEAAGHFDRALDLARKALDGRPGWADAWGFVGDVHLGRARAGVEVDASIEQALGAYREAVRSDPGDPAIVRALAELCFQVGRLQEAEELLTAFAARRPLNPPMSLLLARVHLKGRHADKAEPILISLVSRAPLNMEAVDTLAALYESTERLDEAIALYDPALRAEIGGSGLFDRLGLLHLEAGHDREAIEFLEKARAEDPDNARRLLPLAQAYEAIGDYAAAAKVCDRAVTANPRSIETLFHHARLQRKLGNLVQARRGYDDLIRVGESRETLNDRERTLLTLASAQLGLLSMEAHEYDAAVTAFERAARMDKGERPELVFLLARALMHRGDLDAADRTALSALEQFPEALEMRVLRGEILLARGADKEAAGYFNVLIEGEAGSVEAYLGVGEALMRSKRYGDAETTLAKGLKSHADDDRLLFARGTALERLGEFEQAERALSRAVTVNPDNAMALNYLGYMLADQGIRLADSVSFVERALSLDPENPAYLDSLGWALFKLERYAPAEEKLRAALRYDAADPAIREHLGDLLLATGREEEAVREWEAALKCGHENPERIREKMAKAQERKKSAR